jgi:hypothetical protein
MVSTADIININNPIGVANTELAMVIDYEKADLSNIGLTPRITRYKS